MRPIDPTEVRLAWAFVSNHLLNEISAGEPEGRAALDAVEHAIGVLLGMFPEVAADDEDDHPPADAAGRREDPDHAPR